MENLHEELKDFLGRAMLATYAGGGPEVEPQRKGHKELEFREGDWNYRDSYSGYYQSWGQELVWHKGVPIWTQIYGGGMLLKFQNDRTLSGNTFDFLKEAISAGEKSTTFQPRGPLHYQRESFDYMCNWDGDIRLFEGKERIYRLKEQVFFHNFHGGLIITTI